MSETIVAPITASGLAAVAVVRVSGSRAKDILIKLCPKASSVLSQPRSMVYTPLIDLWAAGDRVGVLDHAMVVYFPGPNSFTGEDCIEFQVHGGTFITRRLLENICRAGARLAQPGEFTQRAYLNGKIDLTQAEAIADVINAESEAQLRVAQEQLSGKLAGAITDFGEPLRDLLAEVEAQLDFPEEGLETPQIKAWLRTAERSISQLGAYIASYQDGRICREGARVVLAGLPNAGKSSVLNRLLGEERVIVTPIPGTTRDSIEERIVLDGVLVRLWDTAGLVGEDVIGRAVSQVERLGVKRSWTLISQADLVVYLFDVERGIEAEQSLFNEVCSRGASVLVVANKADKRPGENTYIQTSLGNAILISARTGFGFDKLKSEISASLLGKQQGPVMVTTKRHVDALKAANEALKRFTDVFRQGAAPLEIAAVELRLALKSLEEIIGVTSNEEILGRIFSKFCIGK